MARFREFRQQLHILDSLTMEVYAIPIYANFTVRLYQQALPADTSGFLSPLSIMVALSMTYLGSGGGTHEQLSRVLYGGKMNDDAVKKYSKDMMSSLRVSENVSTLYLANRLYCQLGFNILEAFDEDLKKYFNSSIQSVDFGKNDEASIEINKWISDVTHGRIDNLVSSNFFNALTRLVIVNAVYFKANWHFKFNPEDTIKKTFFVSQSKQKQVDMMHRQGQFLYHADKQLKILGMPYKAENLKMFFILPISKTGLPTIEAKLTGVELLNLIRFTIISEVKVAIPKFKVKSSFSLNSILTKMGLDEMFSPKLANFSKITGKDDLYVSAVLHQAFVEVNEEGSEAAAATAVIAMVRSAVIVPPKRLEFIADHPFIFTIMDTKSMNILFIGRFMGKLIREKFK
ncbi:unnamed protein product [Soboliphyme baturini]|uniref:SERPIN domain-containing protein n=1 Tax=Soboliphyme baturini TaxID=241478 RepID=A0A183J5D6_9BILA|nr:unnamed protein product [Soboliphyme baturini]